MRIGVRRHQPAASMRSTALLAAPTLIATSRTMSSTRQFGSAGWPLPPCSPPATAACRSLPRSRWLAVATGIVPDDDAAMKELTYGQAIVAGGTAFTGAVPAPHSTETASGRPVHTEI